MSVCNGATRSVNKCGWLDPARPFMCACVVCMHSNDGIMTASYPPPCFISPEAFAQSLSLSFSLSVLENSCGPYGSVTPPRSSSSKHVFILVWRIHWVFLVPRRPLSRGLLLSLPRELSVSVAVLAFLQIPASRCSKAWCFCEPSGYTGLCFGLAANVTFTAIHVF